MIDQLITYITSSQPWWVYALMALVPLCMILCVREFSCWFWKVNKLINRLDKIESRLHGIALGGAPVEQNASSRAKKKIQLDMPPDSEQSDQKES